MSRTSTSPRSTRVLRLLTHPPTSPLLQLTIYYVVLIGLGTLLGIQVPIVGDAIAGIPAADAASREGLGAMLATTGVDRPPFLRFGIDMAIVMLGTVLVTIPFSWGYMSIREHGGYEQSVVQTLVILPIVVAAIMMVVQFSLALAFALGGVAAAVRFRNTLKDVADAVYVFLAIGIGIAAGTGALTAALVMSAIFTYTSVLLWRCNYGECEVARRVHDASPRGREGSQVAPRRRGEISVEGVDRAAQAQVESVLDERTRKWRLSQRSDREGGHALLTYDVRLKRSMPVDAVVVALREQLALAAPLAAVTVRERIAV